MIKSNELVVDGVSTADFNFPIFVEQNDGFQFPKKKNQLIESPYTTGATKNEVSAWPSIVKSYMLYCPTATLKDMRNLKTWAKDNGKLIASDELDVYYEILDVEIEPSPIDRISGYRVWVRFTVNPFGYELNQQVNIYHNGSELINHTNAPMYPRVVVYGNSNKQTSVRIGDQTIYLKDLQTKYTIECKPLFQNLFDQYNNKINITMRGDFFEIPKGSRHVISLGEGVEYIEVLERWGWL